MSENLFFCHEQDKQENLAFNKPVSKERLQQLKQIDIGFKYNKFIGRVDSWKKVTLENWLKITSLPEYNEAVVLKITGLEKIPSNSVVIVVCEGKETEISRESAKSLNLID